MGKSTTAKTPKYVDKARWQANTPSNSNIYNGNDLVASNVWNPSTNSYDTHNYLTAAEQDRKNQTQSAINAILPTLGQTDPALAAQYEQMGNAYGDNAKAEFDRLLKPQERNLREDYASRFGTLQATPYLDAQNDLQENSVIPAYRAIANDATQLRQTLSNNAENQKLQRLQSLGYFLNNDQQAFMNNLGNTQASSQNTNNYNINKYSAFLNQWTNQRAADTLQMEKNNAGLMSFAKAGGEATGTAVKAAGYGGPN